MRGYRTRSFRDLVAIHHRPLGSADGTAARARAARRVRLHRALRPALGRRCGRVKIAAPAAGRLVGRRVLVRLRARRSARGAGAGPGFRRFAAGSCGAACARGNAAISRSRRARTRRCRRRRRRDDQAHSTGASSWAATARATRFDVRGPLRIGRDARPSGRSSRDQRLAGSAHLAAGSSGPPGRRRRALLTAWISASTTMPVGDVREREDVEQHVPDQNTSIAGASRARQCGAAPAHARATCARRSCR